MNKGIILSTLVILIVFFILKIMKYRRKISPVHVHQPVVPFSNTPNTPMRNATPVTELNNAWWKALGSPDQLHLALLLAQKTLPVWEKYISSHDATYRSSSTVPVSKIDGNLLQTAIAEITLNSCLLFPGSSNKKISLCYSDFIGPVIALQDGIWIPPYPVKKIFLAVYYILKSILEQNGFPNMENFLVTSINQTLDCLDMSKLYSREEITGLMADYKNKVYPEVP